MANLKKLTRKQKNALSDNGYDPNDYMFLKTLILGEDNNLTGINREEEKKISWVFVNINNHTNIEVPVID